MLPSGCRMSVLYDHLFFFLFPGTMNRGPLPGIKITSFKLIVPLPTADKNTLYTQPPLYDCVYG